MKEKKFKMIKKRNSKFCEFGSDRRRRDSMIDRENSTLQARRGFFLKSKKKLRGGSMGNALGSLLASKQATHNANTSKFKLTSVAFDLARGRRRSRRAPLNAVQLIITILRISMSAQRRDVGAAHSGCAHKIDASALQSTVTCTCELCLLDVEPLCHAHLCAVAARTINLRAHSHAQTSRNSAPIKTTPGATTHRTVHKGKKRADVANRNITYQT